MKPSNDDIGNIIDKILQDQTTKVKFETVWNAKYKNKRKIFGLRKIVAIPLIAVISFAALFTVGFAGYNAIRNTDRTDYPFIDDSRVQGKWEAVDFVTKVEDFQPGLKSWKSDLFLTTAVFIKDGKLLTAVNRGNLAFTSLSWTKDMILNKQEKTAGKYIIKDINGITYMFFEWKTGDYIFRNQTPWFYVLKRVDNEDYSDYKIKSIKEDNVDYPFVDDVNMKGKWETVDFVQEIGSFKPGIKSWMDDLFLTGMNCEENGKLTAATTLGSSKGASITWTKGLILNKGDKTASKCEIKVIDGKTYMFYEWKSGDYVYRGMKPSYYVLKKVD